MHRIAWVDIHIYLDNEYACLPTLLHSVELQFSREREENKKQSNIGQQQNNLRDYNKSFLFVLEMLQ